ncbi:DUF1643 domain-containing protein [Sphingobium sp.]|uniref:DUF1643 domain-containing protein n=1 Tax=Sphingobium sp. TaxID=1912891 RepID=UPI003BB53605
MSDIEKVVKFSDCGLFRYSLSRKWQSSAHSLPIIMLNPSVADDVIDDPTIKRCKAFARRDGFGGIIVMNLFAFRATKPEIMLSAADPIGPENDGYIDYIMAKAKEDGLPVLAAWGAHGAHRGRGAAIVGKADSLGVDLRCLGTTQGGYPRHPLYVKSDQPLVSLC